MDAATALVGYDGSRQADLAIASAAALLPQMNAIVVNVWHQPSPTYDLLDELIGERRDATAEEIAARLDEVGEAAAQRTAARGAALASEAGWTARPVARRGERGVWCELCALASEREAAITVLGAGGHGGSGPLGRAADAVVRLAERPVLVVRDSVGETAPDAPLVIGYDGSPLAAAAISRAAALFPARRAIVAHVGHLDVAEDGARMASDAGLTAEALTVPAPALDVVRPEGAAWHQLARVADDAGAAAIVVGARGTSALRRFLLGSVTGGLLHHAQRPVVVIPEHAVAKGSS